MIVSHRIEYTYFWLNDCVYAGHPLHTHGSVGGGSRVYTARLALKCAR
jgi:hypothetical protein